MSLGHLRDPTEPAPYFLIVFISKDTVRTIPPPRSQDAPPLALAQHGRGGPNERRHAAATGERTARTATENRGDERSDKKHTLQHAHTNTPVKFARREALSNRRRSRGLYSRPCTTPSVQSGGWEGLLCGHHPISYKTHLRVGAESPPSEANLLGGTRSTDTPITTNRIRTKQS